LVYFVMPGTKPSGSVFVQLFPPSKLAFTPQPSFQFQSLAPVIRLSGFVGLTASGVSFCDVVSRLTFTTKIEGPLTAYDAPADGDVASMRSALHAASETTALTRNAAPALRPAMWLGLCNGECMQHLQ
jgi:hypothetical protein